MHKWSMSDHEQKSRPLSRITPCRPDRGLGSVPGVSGGVGGAGVRCGADRSADGRPPPPVGRYPRRPGRVAAVGGWHRPAEGRQHPPPCGNARRAVGEPPRLTWSVCGQVIALYCVFLTEITHPRLRRNVEQCGLWSVGGKCWGCIYERHDCND